MHSFQNCSRSTTLRPMAMCIYKEGGLMESRSSMASSRFRLCSKSFWLTHFTWQDAHAQAWGGESGGGAMTTREQADDMDAWQTMRELFQAS